jgi:hypothetical protein
MLDIIALHPFLDQNIALPEQPADIPRLAGGLIIDHAHPFEAFRTGDKYPGKTLLLTWKTILIIQDFHRRI